jgi:hypothetical protein
MLIGARGTMVPGTGARGTMVPGTGARGTMVPGTGARGTMVPGTGACMPFAMWGGAGTWSVAGVPTADTSGPPNGCPIVVPKASTPGGRLASCAGCFREFPGSAACPFVPVTVPWAADASPLSTLVMSSMLGRRLFVFSELWRI